MSLRTFDGFQVVLTEKLFAMQALDQDSQQYHAMEQQLGQYCYEAEEQLPQAELRLLKGSLEISGGMWQRYKAAFIASGSA